MSDGMRTVTTKYLLTKPGDRELTLTRTFAAPRQLVFDAFTKPEMLKRWMFGPADWPLVHCEIDLRVGGKMRYLWRHQSKGECGMSGVFREIAAPDRLVHTEMFDEDSTGGETLVTVLFTEHHGRTTVATTIRYSSLEVREATLKTGLIDGWSQGHDRLDELLASIGTPAIS